MKWITVVALLLSGILLTQPAHAQMDKEWEIGRSLDLNCQYSDYKTFQITLIDITIAKEALDDQATPPPFEKTNKTLQRANYRIKSGQQAECRFPTGDEVRVKIGEGNARPYGMCGGDPEVFATIWVNRRKVASHIQFAGHCVEDSDGYSEIGFHLSGTQAGEFNVRQCGTAPKLLPAETQKDSKQSAPHQICLNYPNIHRFPVDAIEYPAKGSPRKRPGDIETLAGHHAVCDAALKELRNDFNTFGKYPNQNTKLLRPEWDSPSIELPDELARSSESIFDFDNDGKLDRVLSQLQESTYSDGTVLLLQPGKSRKELITNGSLLDSSSRFLPCQLDRKLHSINSCPGFSQNADEAAFQLRGNMAQDTVQFRARYTALVPFLFGGNNYLGVSSISMGSENYVGVIKPLPGNKFQQMCLFRRVPENY